MNVHKICVLLTGCALLSGQTAWAIFPFDFGKKEIKTDYSQTVWDQMMREQSMSDMRRGMGEMSGSKYQAAANSFAKAIIKNPKDALPHFLYGASLYWSGKVDDAMSEYRTGLQLDPRDPMGYQLLGIAWGWKGDIEQAQENFLKATQLNPFKADSHMNLGSTYAAQKKFDKALDSYRRAVELAPREPLYQYQLGTLYDYMGRDAQAETAYKKALKLFFRYEDAQLALAALYEKQERYEDALKYYKKAVKTKPGDFVARLRYANLLLQQRQTAQAREVVEGAFSIVQFKQDGLALNAVYRADGRNVQNFEQQIEKFKESLLKIPAAKDIQIEVSLNYEPPAAPAQSAHKKDRFSEAYASIKPTLSAANQPEQLPAMSFQRSFVLNGGEAEQRTEQVNELAAELMRAVQAGSNKYDISMTLQGRTSDYSAAHALTQNRTITPKAVYDPRIVGNDMGLWVMGKSWVRYVEEIYTDLQEQVQQSASSEYGLLLGLAGLLNGQSAAAQQSFQAVLQQRPADILPLLGLGTAAVVAGEDAQAADYYRQALQLDPSNKTAKRNLEVLEEL